MKRLGTVLVFKKGVDMVEAALAIKSIADVIDRDYYTRDPKDFHHSRHIHRFDDKIGVPAFYNTSSKVFVKQKL